MSVPFRASEAAAWAGGRIVAGDPEATIEAVVIDSRKVTQGALFVAIAGPNHDGHDFLAAVVDDGATAVLVDEGAALPTLPERVAVIAVDDTTRGIGALASGHRAGFEGPLVGITGSNGKTTTKEMCAAILEVGAPTLRTRGNLNNHYGLPLTLLSREPGHRRAVIELGMNHRGEIAPLAAIARPTVAAVTNIGTAHIEHLGSREEIAAEKGDLIAALRDDGTAVVNAADDFADTLAGRAPGRVLRFGREAQADVRAESIRHEAGRFAFRLALPGDAIDVAVGGLGDTTVDNALCASAAAFAAGASPAEIATGLAGYRGVAGRLEARRLANEVVVIDDSYNANPQSMEVALRLLARSGDARRIAVLGDMGELGDAAEKAHDDAGRLVATLGIDLLVAVGSHAERVATAAREAGLPAAQVHTARDSEAAGPQVRALVGAGDWVLLKGSRSMRMERVGQYLESEDRA